MSRRMDAAEAITSTAVGFAVSMALTFWALPLWGFEPSPFDAMGITALYTGASIVRGYVVRRAFRRIATGADVR